MSIINFKMSSIQFAFKPDSQAIKVFCLDVSGSTGNVSEYHTLSKLIYDTLKVSQLKIIGWDTTPQILTEEKYNIIQSKRQGFGGTLTSAIAQGLMNIACDGPIDLVILTDGEVDLKDISLCDNIMKDVVKKHTIASVSAFISTHNTVNCSVLAPFIRGEWNSLVFHNNKEIYNMNVKERNEMLELVRNASTANEIDAVYDKLVTLLTAMTMGKREGDPMLRSLILEMFSRIKTNIKKSLSSSEILTEIENEFFDTKDISVRSAKKLNEWYQISFNGVDFQSKIDFLLRLCDGKLSHLFDPKAIRDASIQRATVETTPQTESQLTMVNPTTLTDPIECPILLDSSPNQCIMINDGTPLFLDASKSMQDTIMSNTFFATSMNDLIKNRLDHGMSLEAYLDMVDKSVSPMTRATICGLIVLGDDPVSVSVTNDTIGKMLLGKHGIIGNPDVWFYVIYNCIKSGQVPWLELYLPMFENQLRYRMKNSSCTISMSGFPSHMQLKTKFGVALRFVLSQAELEMPKNISSFPTFSGSTHHIINLLNLYGCDVSPKLMKYCTLVQTLSHLVKEVKQLHMYAFETKYRSLFGNFYYIQASDLTPKVLSDSVSNGWFTEFVPVDGIQENLPPHAENHSKDCLTYNLAKLIVNNGSESITTFNLLESISYNDIDIFFNEPVITNDWPLYVNRTHSSFFQIHPKTLRPLTFVNGKHWKKSFVEVFNNDGHFTKQIFDATPEQKPSGDVFSGCRYYADFVNVYGFHPTLSDFVLFCLKTVKYSQYHHVTIPSVQFCKKIIDSYNFSRTLPVSTFITQYDASRNRETRIKIEESY